MKLRETADKICKIGLKNSNGKSFIFHSILPCFFMINLRYFTIFIFQYVQTCIRNKNFKNQVFAKVQR